MGKILDTKYLRREIIGKEDNCFILEMETYQKVLVTPKELIVIMDKTKEIIDEAVKAKEDLAFYDPFLKEAKKMVAEAEEQKPLGNMGKARVLPKKK